jgi:hypothetical protein
VANRLIQDCVFSGPILKPGAGHEENWHLGVQLPYRLNQRQPVHSRHLDIGEQQFDAGSDCTNDLVGFESILRFDGVKARLSQDRGYRRSEERLIVYDENWHCTTPAIKSRRIAPVVASLAYYCR